MESKGTPHMNSILLQNMELNFFKKIEPQFLANNCFQMNCNGIPYNESFDSQIELVNLGNNNRTCRFMQCSPEIANPVANHMKSAVTQKVDAPLFAKKMRLKYLQFTWLHINCICIRRLETIDIIR